MTVEIDHTASILGLSLALVLDARTRHGYITDPRSMHDVLIGAAGAHRTRVGRNPSQDAMARAYWGIMPACNPWLAAQRVS